MKQEYIVLAATYGKLRKILGGAEPAPASWPKLIYPDTFEILVLLDKVNQRIILDVDKTFSPEEVDMAKLLELPVYGGEYTISFSAFHGLQIRRGLGFSPLSGLATTITKLQELPMDRPEPNENALRAVFLFKEKSTSDAEKNRARQLLEFYNRMKFDELDVSKNHVPVDLIDVLKAGEEFDPEGVLLLTEYGGLCYIDPDKTMKYMKYDVHAKRFHTIVVGS